MKTLDLVIIGSGPAGLSAAVYAARAELDFIVIERSSVSGGQVLTTYEVDNYLGLPGRSGADLSNSFREHCDKLGVSFVTDEVRSIEKSDEVFTIKTWDGETYLAKNVIAATGASHRLLGCPGEEDLTGAGVSYCATCDGAFFKGQTVAVVGGGDVAVEDAIYLSKIAAKVYLIHRRSEFRAAATLVTKARGIDNIEFVTDSVVNEIKGSDTVESILIENKQTRSCSTLSVNGIFIAVGIDPATELFRGLCETNPAGYIVADETCRTSCPGLYAVGDLRSKPLRQIITAAADGANAVTSILATM